jgi:putative nucleotidyltransferase with HDIG domain
MAGVSGDIVPTEHSKPTILIVEDEEGPRNALKIILRPFYELAITNNRTEALQALQTYPVDLVTLDLKLPDGYGLDLFHAIKGARRGVEIVIITGYGTLKSSQEAVQHGAAGYLLKPFNVSELIALINRTLERKRRLDGIRDFLRSAWSLWKDGPAATRTWARLREQFPASAPGHFAPPSPDPRDAGALSLLADLMEASDHALLARASRVHGYASLLAAPLELTPADQHVLAVGAFLHDIGHVALDRSKGPAQNGNGSDDADTLHTRFGVRIATAAGMPGGALQIIAHHHERHDGTGHPSRLVGDRIPLLARIVAVARTFDRLTAPDRPAAIPFAEACEQLGGEAGTALDPSLVDVFLKRLSERQPPQPARTHA